ncbi:MAG TPA: hypothetical protein VJB57_11120 [Dehalococcoidia bacterium]|nr:hypothetical protein [Dehalococcoidia bacterium]
MKVLDLGKGVELPESVVAVPAYTLDGRLVSLGNPDVAELSTLIEQSLAQEARLEGAEKA